jgi:hypothetical protein
MERGRVTLVNAALLSTLLRSRRSSSRAAWLVALALLSCSGEEGRDSDSEARERLGSVKQAITDTDSDGMDDDWENTHFGTLSRTGSGDFDSDGMTDLEEYVHDLDPTVNDAFDDADGDRYPNVFEVRNSADPNDSGSVPSATFTVNGAGGGTHTSVSAAVNAASLTNGAYQIIAIAPGVYTAGANDISLTTSKPKFLIIGLEGAAKTIIDGGGTPDTWGWAIGNAAVISSLTFRRWSGALGVTASGHEIRFVDLIVRDNGNPWWPAGIHIDQAAKVYVVGSTFVDNVGGSSYGQIYANASTTVLNTVVWGQGTGSMLTKNTGVTLVTNHCLVKGQTLTGTGNLAGSTDPKLRSDAHLLWDSPLRAAGGTVAQSRVDVDGEARPSGTPDIGVDQFVDSDSDDLADSWEVAEAGNLTTLTSRTQDADSDGLTNEAEYAAFVKPTVADTDADGLSDGAEVNTHGTNPLVTDTDGDDMPDGWEITNGISATVANAFEDKDGDRYPNVFEYVSSTDPSSASSIPTPTYTVNGAGGGTHTTISAALSAANVSNGAYQIIGIAPGVYSGGANLRDVTIPSSKPKLLFIGLEGAAKTVIDGGLTNNGWWIQNSAVISSLTFQKASVAHYVDGAGIEVRFVDLIVRDNTASSWAAGVHVNAASKVHIVGSTFLDNNGFSNARQIWGGSGTTNIMNTVVSGSASGTMVEKGWGTTLTTNYCLVKGQTLVGTGNLAGATNPKLRSDGRLLWDSPLRAAGGTVLQSRIDIDGEARPSSSPDIGADQFVDSDSDDLADTFELTEAGNLTTLTGRTQDADSDGLANDAEYVALTKPTVADTDGDGLSDGAEVNTHGTNPVVTDTDGDDMPDPWEVANGISPTVANGFEDKDGDRYPNVFEYVSSTDPSSASSIPTPTYTVNGAGGGTHTTISAALSAANVSNGAYQIIAIAPGVYTGAANLRDVTIQSTKPKLLFIGLEGAGKTIIDGARSNFGWLIQGTAIVSSLTFQNTLGALYVDAPGKHVGLIGLFVHDNRSPSGNYTTPGLHVNAATTVDVAGSTFANNDTTQTAVKQIYVREGVASLINTVVWSKSSGTMLDKYPYYGLATVNTSYCFVKGQTLTGTGNLAGNVDPKLRSDMHLRVNSPLRSAGGAVAHSRIDIDGELRPSTSPDIGIDQFNDADSDGLPDAWEIATAGNTTTIAGAADEDSDGLSNANEYDLETDWLVTDSDRDGIVDGLELTLGMNPAVADADDLVSDSNQDGLIDSVGGQVGYQPNQTDDDGDSVSNADEVLMCTNPFRADTDGDGVADGTDKFPHDPLMSSLPSNSSDTTAPVITLTAPWFAVLQ